MVYLLLTEQNLTPGSLRLIGVSFLAHWALLSVTDLPGGGGEGVGPLYALRWPSYWSPLNSLSSRSTHSTLECTSLLCLILCHPTCSPDSKSDDLFLLVVFRTAMISLLIAYKFSYH